MNTHPPFTLVAGTGPQSAFSSCVYVPPPPPLFPAQAQADARRDGWNEAVEVCAVLAEGGGPALVKLIRSLKK